LEEAFFYSLIKHCKTDYPVPKPQDYELIFDLKCCLSFELRVSGEFSVTETFCSFRQNLETCLLEIRLIQKKLEESCEKFNIAKKNESGNFETISDPIVEMMTIQDGISQLEKDDLKIAKILGNDVVIEESIKCCSCEKEKQVNRTTTAENKTNNETI
jgi:hypothetical protein